MAQDNQDNQVNQYNQGSQQIGVQEITLQLPWDYVMPKIFQYANPQETAEVLTLGSSAYEFVNREGSKLKHEALYKQLHERAVQEYEPRLQANQKELLTAQEALAQTRRKLQQELTERQELDGRIRREERANREELLKEKDRQIAALQGQAEKQQQTTLALGDKIQTLIMTMTKQGANSKLKGDQGEKAFEAILRLVFGSEVAGSFFDVQHTGKEARKGDIRMSWRGHQVLFEVKNYDYSIPTPEINKFKRDMEEAKEVSFGVFVALKSNITGHQKSGPVDISILPDGRTCIFFNNFFGQEDPQFTLQTIKPFFELLIEDLNKKAVAAATPNQDTKQTLTIDSYRRHREKIIASLKRHAEKSKRHRDNLRAFKKNFEKMLNELDEDIKEDEVSLKNFLKMCMYNPENLDTTEDQEDALELPSFVFQKPSLEDYDAESQKFIKHLLGMYTFEEDAKVCIAKKELKESFKDTYSEDQASRFLEKVLLAEVWDKGKQKVKYLQRSA
jgi:hypothetical protein